MAETTSLRKRYLYKLSGNFIGAFINIVIQAIIPRELGPKAYGNFNFLTNFFTQVVNFLEMGTSTCFYTKLSQRPKESGLVIFYIYFTGFVFFCISGFVFLSFLTLANEKFWPDQAVLFIYLAAGLGFITWVVQVLNQMLDAYGLTTHSEFVRILQKVLGMVLIVLLYLFHQLTLANFFYYNFFILIFLGVAFLWVIDRGVFFAQQNWKLSREEVKKYSSEFYHYSHPLFIYVLVGLVVNILDRWLLQIYGGSIHQGFYSLAYQIGTICFLFTGALTPLLLREFSISFNKHDLPQMRYLFRRYIPLLCSTTAYFSAFIVLQAHNVIYIMGGSKFDGAVKPVAIMAFYPIYQTYGQLSGSVFYATGQTSLYRNIGVLFMLIGLPVTYFLIAPGDKFGLNLGSTGLAVKMVILQFIGVNVQLCFNTKFLGLSFRKYVGHQLFSVGCMLSCAAVATFLVNHTLGSYVNVVISFVLAGFFYTLLVGCLVYYKPVVFGLKSEDIRSLSEFFIFNKNKIRE